MSAERAKKILASEKVRDTVEGALDRIEEGDIQDYESKREAIETNVAYGRNLSGVLENAEEYDLEDVVNNAIEDYDLDSSMGSEKRNPQRNKIFG